jgi:cysteine desulfurase
VVPVTDNFQSEAAINPIARDAFLGAIDAGWADPKKIGQLPNKAAVLQNSALESIAARLGLKLNQVEITGEVGLSYFLSLGGLLQENKNLFFGAGDRSGVIATVRSHPGQVSEIALTADGRIDFASVEISSNSVLAFQLANGETGVINELPSQQSNDLPSDLLIAIDATASGARIALPEKWSSAAFDSRSWGGPGGLAIVAINNPAHWSNPLPHISSVRRTYGTYSLPLLLASAVALENFHPDEPEIRRLTAKLRSQIQQALPEVFTAGDLNNSMPHLTSFVFPKTNGEEILRELTKREINVDSGSACTAMNLQPSHVLAAMGLPTDGNVRVSIHSDTTEAAVDRLISALKDVVQLQQQR